jgi:chromate transporter
LTLRHERLRELASLFLRLGTISFGGPAAHIALMHDEVVRRRQWLPEQEFLDLLGATNLIPGPNSTELAIHIGHRRAGWPGLLVAGACFILPAAVIVTALAWVYVTYGALPEAHAVLYGVKPAMIAIVLQALIALSHTALKSSGLVVLGIACAAAVFAGVHELAVLFGGALLWLVWKSGSGRDTRMLAVPIWPLFLFFVKTGSVLFGSGYVLLAFLRADLVERWGWLTESQLLDAIAVGQVTPGPVFTTATFIGYILAGPIGAVVATIGIFLPAFFFVAISGPLVPRLRQSPLASTFLDGVNATSLALMAAVTWQLGRSAIVDPVTLLIAVAAAVALLRYKLNSAWLVLGGALAGLLRTLV